MISNKLPVLQVNNQLIKLAAYAGWRRNIIAFLAGAASILAFAPFHISPILFFTLPFLLWLTDPAPLLFSKGSPDRLKDSAIAMRPVFSLQCARRGFAVGWWFGFGFHFAGLYWIGGAFLVQHEVFAWLMPFAITLMPACLALFWGAAIAALACFAGPAFARILVLIVALTAAEWLRGNIFTGFPWNILGYSLAYPLVFLQTAGVVGIYGMTFVSVAVFSTPLPVILETIRCRRLNAAIRPVLACVVFPIITMFIYGVYVIIQPTPDEIANVKVRLVQPSINQRDKFDPEKRFEIFKRHLELSSRGPQDFKAAENGITHIIWPEAALAFLALRSPDVMNTLADTLPDNTTLIAGTLRLEGQLGRNPSKYRVFNSAMVVSGDGRVSNVYDKVHLVPFGEYLPFQDWLEAIGLEQLTRVRGGFAAGAQQRKMLHIPGLGDVRILICYEVIFPEEVIPSSRRPDILINLTNDAWYGRSTGPFQHFHQSVVRAVEQGLPLIRVGNNGISGVIDPYGRVLGKLDLDATDALDSRVPRALKPTIYSRFGDLPFVMLWLILFSFISLAASKTLSRGQPLEID